MLIRRGQNGVQSMPRTGPWRTYSQVATRRLLFKYVHWLWCIVILYLHVLTIMICLFDNSVINYLSLSFLHVGNLIHNTDWCLFSQVKNKHDIHEFILDSGTVANTSYLGYIFRTGMDTSLSSPDTCFYQTKPCVQVWSSQIWFGVEVGCALKGLAKPPNWAQLQPILNMMQLYLPQMRTA